MSRTSFDEFRGKWVGESHRALCMDGPSTNDSLSTGRQESLGKKTNASPDSLRDGARIFPSQA